MNKNVFLVLVLRLLVTLVSLGIMIPYIGEAVNLTFQITACVYGLGKLIDLAISVDNSGYKRYNLVCVMALFACLVSITINFVIFAENAVDLSNSTAQSFENMTELSNTTDGGNESQDSYEEKTTDRNIAGVFKGISNWLVMILLIISSSPDFIVLGDYIARLRNTKKVIGCSS